MRNIRPFESTAGLFSYDEKTGEKVLYDLNQTPSSISGLRHAFYNSEYKKNWPVLIKT